MPLTPTDLSLIRDRRIRWVLLVLVASLPLLGWWSYGLFDLDEGFYAAVVGSMIRRHEWITPYFNGEPWFEKPILLYWLAKLTVVPFGQEFGPRLPSVLSTVATYALVAWFAVRRFGALAGVMSLFVLGGSLLPVALGRMMMTDSLLMLCLTAAMITFWESLVSHPRWRLATAAFLGLAVLAKGPVSLILFALIAAWTYWRILSPSEGSPSRASFRGYWLLGVGVLCAVIAAWYVPAYLANGDRFVDEFLIEQNVGRFTGGDQAHTIPLYKGFYFYLPVILLGMLPWSLFVPAAWPRRMASGSTESSQLKRYLAGWAAIIFLFFTVSSAKLPHYVLPCCPPLAILLGIYFAERWQGLPRSAMRPKFLLATAWLAAVWAVAQVGFQFWYAKSGQAEAHALALRIRHTYPDHEVIAYQLPRRTKELGTGKMQIQETSLPSLSFYTGRDVVAMEAAKDLRKVRGPAIVFTRVGRIGDPIPPSFARGVGDESMQRLWSGRHYETILLPRSNLHASRLHRVNP